MLRLAVRAAASSRCQIINLFERKVTETVTKCFQPTIYQYHTITSVLPQQKYTNKLPLLQSSSSTSLLQNVAILQIAQNISRPVTKFSLQKGKRKSVKAVLKRFYRLDWGGWIRTKSGRNKKLWKKSESQKRRLREHVFVNGTQSWLLDKMVTKYWRKPKYYVDDPYEPYHQREEFYITRKKPL
ncbi:mitochondrial ribosomal protein L35 [Carabus blaptoides fortunei]